MGDDRRHHGPQDLPSVRRLAWNQIRDNDDRESVVTGEPGSGKSRFGVMSAEELEPHPKAPKKADWDEYQEWRLDRIMSRGFDPVTVLPIRLDEVVRYSDAQAWAADGYPHLQGWQDLLVDEIGRPYLLDLDLQIVYSSKDSIDAGQILEPGRQIIDDEFIGAGGNRRAAMTKENREKQTDVNLRRKLQHGRWSIIPDYDDGDPRALKWADEVYEITGRGSGIYYEQIRVGGPKKKSVWLQDRFPFSFPDLRLINPALDLAYDRLSKDNARGQREDRDLGRRHQYEKIVDSVIMRRR